MINQPLRIAQVIGKANLSGVDTVVMEYYRHIDRRRFQFDFIIDGYDETSIDREVQKLGGRIYKFEPYEQSMVRSVRNWSALFKENCYHIVHSHLNTLSVFPLYAAWRAGTPVRIAHNHSTAAPGEGKRTIMKYMLRPSARHFATHYCACSKLAGKWLFGDSLYDSGKVHLIKNAINIDRFSYSARTRDLVRQEFKFGGKFVVGHVGRFTYQKNHDFLIEIFQEIYKRNENAILMLIGAGELEQAIKQKVKALGLNASVLFMGQRTDVSNLMQAMDVFVFPSNYEGLGMVAIEAQAASLRTIVSEAVPEEARVTELLEYCSLSQPASVWAENVLACCGEENRNEVYCRYQPDKQLRQAGYDIAEAAGELGKWYGELVLCERSS